MLIGAVGIPRSACDEQGDKTVNVTDPMEKRKIGDVNVIVPKGSITHRQGDLRVIEGASEYTARKLEEVDVRMGQIESSVDDLERELAGLKAEIEQGKKRALVSSKS